jgi:hypothetical protein
VHDAQQSADRQRGAQVQPWLDLLPAPAVHADLAPLAALAASHEDRAGAAVKIASARASASLIRSPARHKTTISARTRSPWALGPADRNDLVDRRRIGGVLSVLVARRVAAVVTGHRGRRAATPGGMRAAQKWT